jgi:hypothetical protein
MTGKKITMESPPEPKHGSNRDPDTGMRELVEAAMKNRGEWVSMEKENEKNMTTAVKARVGSLFCEFSVAGGKRMFLRIKTEDEL